VLVNHVKGILWGRVGSWVITRSDSRLRLRVWKRQRPITKLLLSGKKDDKKHVLRLG